MRRMLRLSEPPRRLDLVDEAKTLLAIEWPDGHQSPYPLLYLRGWCPCAACQGHGAGHAFVAASPGDALLAAMAYVGNYGVSLTWKDGHATGIHTWQALRAECPCAACGGPRAGTPPEVAALVPTSLPQRVTER